MKPLSSLWMRLRNMTPPYQEPPLGHPPLLVVVQLRVTPEPVLVIVNRLPVADRPTTL